MESTGISFPKIHGDKYDYSKVEYAHSKKKVCIICPEHGEFWVTPCAHIHNKIGCKKCYLHKNKYGQLKPLETFISEAKKIHGDKYDYSKVEYEGAFVKVCIICQKHGEFWQRPTDHLSGNGCRKCNTDKVRSNKEIFIEKAKEIHGDKYDYSKVEYVHNKKKVCIICPEHGEFWIKPNSHLNGQGCPTCVESNLERDIRLLLEKNAIDYSKQKKYHWLKYKGNLSLDFFLPQYNVAIECQGLQHFKPVDFFDKEDGFEYRIERDKKKNELCLKHGIKIFYYSNLGIEYPYKVYEDFNKMIEDIKDYSYFNNVKKIIAKTTYV